MRVIVAVVLLGLVGYGGYWLLASRALSAQIDQVLVTSDAIAASDVQVSGFPYRFDLRARDVALASADAQQTWFAPDVTLTALSYRPHHLIGFVTGEQALTWNGVPMTLNSESTRASLVLTPGTALAVARANLVVDAPVLQVAGTAHRADTVRAALRAPDTDAPTLDLAIEALTLTPDPALVAGLDPAGTLPAMIARIGLDATLVLDAPVGLRSARKVEGIDLRALNFEWGTLVVSATGTLRPDGAGTLGGQITLQVQGWPLLLDALARNGAIAPDMLGMARQMAASMADPSTGELTLPLSVAGSRVSLGPFVLGQLPRF